MCLPHDIGDSGVFKLAFPSALDTLATLSDKQVTVIKPISVDKPNWVGSII